MKASKTVILIASAAVVVLLLAAALFAHKSCASLEKDGRWCSFERTKIVPLLGLGSECRLYARHVPEWRDDLKKLNDEVLESEQFSEDDVSPNDEDQSSATPSPGVKKSGNHEANMDADSDSDVDEDKWWDEETAEDRDTSASGDLPEENLEEAVENIRGLLSQASTAFRDEIHLSGLLKDPNQDIDGKKKELVAKYNEQKDLYAEGLNEFVESGLAMYQWDATRANYESLVSKVFPAIESCANK